MSSTNTPDSTAAGEPVLMSPRSRYAGREMDTSSRRSIHVRNAESLADSGVAVVDRFFHEDRYWTAAVPLGGVAQIYGQVFNFSKTRTRQGKDGPEPILNQHGIPKRTIPMLNHVQSRFTFPEGHAVELFPLGAEPEGEPAARISDIVYSVEAVGPLGVNFNLRDGLFGNLVSAHRLFSTEQMVFERIVVENQYVIESPPLPLSAEVKQDLLVRSLLRSHQAGDDEAYYLFGLWGTNNCTSNPFQIVDEVMDYTWFQKICSMLYRFPLSPRLYLRLRGLDSDPQHRKLVREEFSEFIESESTRSRKRQFVRKFAKLRRAAREADPPSGKS